MLERMFHPELFKISMCQRGANGQQCDRGNLCAFAHSDEDHRIPASQTLAKQQGTSGSSKESPISSSTASNQDSLQVSKTLTLDSRQLDSIQDKLTKLIKSQGAEGIISSELPKRYFDVYNERLELTDEAGEKFRIKDLLLAQPCISVVMHKGVQPRYVYEEVAPAAVVAPAATVAAVPSTSTPAPTVLSSVKPAGTPISYAALAAGSVSYSAVINGVSKPVTAPVVPVVVETPVAVAESTTASGRTSRRRGPSESDAVPVAPAAVETTPSASGFDFSKAAPLGFDYSSAAATTSPVVPQTGGPRRRGPDTAIESPAEPFAINQLLASASLDDVATLKQQVSTLQSSLEAKNGELERVSESLEIEVRKRDQLIVQLRQEKAAELNQFKHNISLIENALIETQRQESIYINEISLHDTINKSSRARDDLTKFVNILKLQLMSRISANESQQLSSIAAINTNVSKSSLTSFLHANGINGNLNGAGTESNSSAINYLTKPVAAEVHVHEDSFAQQAQQHTAASSGHVHNHTGVLMCSLPGCGLEGSFICSACGKAGYCGADHQREHWALHINDCTP